MIYHVVIMQLMKYVNQHDIMSVEKRITLNEIFDWMNSIEMLRFDFVNELTNDLNFCIFVTSNRSTLQKIFLFVKQYNTNDTMLIDFHFRYQDLLFVIYLKVDYNKMTITIIIIRTQHDFVYNSECLKSCNHR